ncbi:hypothetical protein M7I_3231 [Glarea lozoyensis 74030]|uniref:Wax synthase domain-containing protein n=1 Tax=Glarea lozoyensis (strain ATCC 74030 / MF5533) TaxID=1104152 RepID=H0EKZ7_GLAL7|nr:hypothetical protein M7I_3231 [Glarea lozoyensis 74030]
MSLVASPLTNTSTAQTAPSFHSAPAWSLNDTRAHLPKWYVPAFFVVLVASLALPAGKARIYSTLPIVLGLCAMLPYHTEGSFKKDFDLGNLVLGWFLVYISLVLTSPETQFWKQDGRKLSPEERMRELEGAGYLKKLAWSFNVWTNPRGIGWSHQVGGLRPAAPEGTTVNIRRFWGMVWHQFMRQVAHSGGLLLSRDMFKLPKGSSISRLVYLVGAFASTGFYHTIVTVYATAFRAGLNPCGDLQFFVLQAVGMFMEGWAIDFVLWSGHGGNKTGWKYFGYLWWASWLGYSCLWYLEELRKAGLWDVDLKVLGYFGFTL